MSVNLQQQQARAVSFMEAMYALKSGGVYLSPENRERDQVAALRERYVRGAISLAGFEEAVEVVLRSNAT